MSILIWVLIALLVFLLAIWAAKQACAALNVPSNITQIVLVIIGLIFLLYLIRLLGFLDFYIPLPVPHR